MRKFVLGMMAALMTAAISGCAGLETLSDEYVTIEKYKGIEIENVETEEVTEEDIDKVVTHMMEGYIAEHDLPADTEITDDIVKETMSQTAGTVEAYREELRQQIKSAKEESARGTKETKVWEKVMDNTEVKKYPRDRLKEVKNSLIELYEGYAKEQNMDYEKYLEVIKLEDEDLDEAAKASVKQELAANLIAKENGLKPTEEEFQKILKEYAAEYKFSNVELLLKAVSREELYALAVQDNVKSWLVDQCKLRGM